MLGVGGQDVVARRHHLPLSECGKAIVYRIVSYRRVLYIIRYDTNYKTVDTPLSPMTYVFSTCCGAFQRSVRTLRMTTAITKAKVSSKRGTR